ncbi:MAG: hypothetical protein ABW168_09790 [Sedimenticola sp.]
MPQWNCLPDIFSMPLVVMFFGFIMISLSTFLLTVLSRKDDRDDGREH